MTSPTTLEALLRRARRAIVIGIGGGGDIAGTVPTLDLLSLFGVSWVAGGLTWERIVYDPRPGPRPLAEVVYATPFAPCAALANARTRTADGVTFAESAFAAVFNCETLLLDINQGVQGIVDSLRMALTHLEADLLIGVDVGGDSLAMGNEPGLRSPLADGVMLASLARLEEEGVPTMLGVLGYGCDGELTPAELDARIAAIAASGGYLGAWGMTHRAVADLERLLTQLHSEASQIPLQAARGALGRRPIRDGAAEVVLSPLATLTFFLDPMTTVREVAVPAQRVARSTSLDEANDALHALGLRTELDRERWMESQGVRDYRREKEFQEQARQEQPPEA
ncbi:MAG: DUF1152 domain-containing protein [Chloroflexi bacterium]|nr:DUF1152 domain-containing protein [Chloroflexota bacterium]